jgi:hypothetical protein
VTISQQTLTSAQQAQIRTNISAASQADVNTLNNNINGNFIADCNSVEIGKIQRFRFNSSTLNTPYKQGITAFSEGWVESYLSNANYGIQTAYLTGKDQYTRVLNNGTWGNWGTVNDNIAVLNGRISGSSKVYGVSNKRYLKITLPQNSRYGSLMVICSGNIATYNFNGTATKVSGNYNISQSDDVFTVDFESTWAHWGAIAFGSVATGAFESSN